MKKKMSHLTVLSRFYTLVDFSFYTRFYTINEITIAIG